MNEAIFEQSGELTKIQGQSRVGDFVLQNQEIATDAGFSHVSKIWYDKTLSYDDGFKAIELDRNRTEDIFANVQEMEPVVTEDDCFALKYSDGRLFLPNEHSIGHCGIKADFATGFAYKLTQPKLSANDEVKYIRDRQDAETLLAIFKNGWRRLPKDKSYLWRTRKPEEGHKYGEVRAMLTDKYAIINNEWFLNIIKDTIPGGRLSHWRGDSDTLFGNILVPDTLRKEEDSDYGGMVSVSNCEIGTRRFGVCPSVFRAICMNGCIWDQAAGKALNMVHKGKINHNDLEIKVRDNILKQLDLLETGIKMLLDTRNFKIDEDVTINPVFAQLAIDYGFSKVEIASAVESYYHPDEPQERRLFDVVNAITRTGQELDNARWVRFDEIAGDLIRYNESDWRSLVNRAKNLKADKVDSLLALAS